jgi:hypothetical protein
VWRRKLTPTWQWIEVVKGSLSSKSHHFQPHRNALKRTTILTARPLSINNPTLDESCYIPNLVATFADILELETQLQLTTTAISMI